MKKQSSWVLVAVAVCSQALFACGGNDAPQGGLLLDAMVPVEGGQAANGGSMQDAAQLATCKADTDCGATLPHCDTSAGVCGLCASNTHCSDPRLAACNMQTHECVECAGDGDCGGATPYCDTTRSVCTECVADANCGAATLVCNTLTGSCAQRCDTSGDCGIDAPYCNTTVHACVECVGDGNCTQSSRPVCNLDTNECVECTSTAQCDVNAPECDPVSHRCVECIASQDCSGAQSTCVAGRCECAPGTDYCAGDCVDTKTDVMHCGSCGNACDASKEDCVDGSCRPRCSSSGECAAPLPYCDTNAGYCVQCLGDGNCGSTPSTPVCRLSDFTCVECTAQNDAACGGSTPFCDVARSTCVECTSSAQCTGALTVCVQGQCECGGAMLQCGGAGCIDPNTNFDNCGGCGNNCDPLYTTACSGGNCQCKAGLSACGNNCVDLQNDPNRCGSCGKQCNADEACVAGQCTCRPGLTDCGGNCVDLKADPNHCGACNNAACQQNERCDVGMCTTNACSTPDACSVSNNRTACVDFDTDPLNCGGCGNNCDRDKLCVNGNCQDFAPAAGCNSCPCNAVCDDRIGGNAVCCDIPSLGSNPFCVDNACP